VPCFHTHWLVAVQAIGNAPEYVQNGKRRYEKACVKYAQALRQVIDAAASDPKRTRSTIRGALKKAEDDWVDDTKKAETYDDITCFSAYMLGACGPDFWTVPSHSRRRTNPRRCCSGRCWRALASRSRSSRPWTSPSCVPAACGPLPSREAWLARTGPCPSWAMPTRPRRAWLAKPSRRGLSRVQETQACALLPTIP